MKILSRLSARPWTLVAVVVALLAAHGLAFYFLRHLALFLMLLAISNDLSLRVLKTKRWKSLQRWTYAAFVLTAAHGIAYQLIEKRHVPVGSCLCIGHGRGCCWTNPRLCPGSTGDEPWSGRLD